jgi:hypothetical protein
MGYNRFFELRYPNFKERLFMKKRIRTPRKEVGSTTFKMTAGNNAIVPIPLLLQNRSVVIKKQSISLQYINILEQLSHFHRWAINDIVNYGLEIFLYLIDVPRKEDWETSPLILLEADSFCYLKNYASRNKLKDSELIRYAVELFVTLIRYNIIEKGLEIEAVQKGMRTLPGVFSDILKVEIEKNEGFLSNEKEAYSLRKAIFQKEKRSSFYHSNKYEDVPCAFAYVSEIFVKKQSISIKYSNVIEQIASQYRWSVNDLVNYALEVLLSFIDCNTKDENNFFESYSFQELKNYAIREKTYDGEILRASLEIFARFLKEGILEYLLDLKAIQNKEITLPLYIAQALSSGILEWNEERKEKSLSLNESLRSSKDKR